MHSLVGECYKLEYFGCSVNFHGYYKFVGSERVKNCRQPAKTICNTFLCTNQDLRLFFFIERPSYGAEIIIVGSNFGSLYSDH